ncbi:MAG: hypothetical protein GKR93_02510 [Gammaproteobacteria bacterium]|nr:hypothetical protein [Gammaproteobacteria bacterium]
MSLYSDTNLPIPSSFESLHEDELLSFARPGTWGTATQRRAIAAEARKARVEAGMQESVGDETLAESADLPEVARRLARDVALAGIGIDRDYCKKVQVEGLSEGAYVEIVGLVARLAHLDVFARGIGVSSRQLAEPQEDKAPSMQRPAVARQEGFFTASIPSAPEGGEIALELFGSEPAPNIVRSLSLVPEEARRLNTVIDMEYFSAETIFDLTRSSLRALSRPQMELVAAKISALNQCFY